MWLLTQLPFHRVCFSAAECCSCCLSQKCCAFVCVSYMPSLWLFLCVFISSCLDFLLVFQDIFSERDLFESMDFGSETHILPFCGTSPLIIVFTCINFTNMKKLTFSGYYLTLMIDNNISLEYYFIITLKYMKHTHTHKCKNNFFLC